MSFVFIHPHHSAVAYRLKNHSLHGSASACVLIHVRVLVIVIVHMRWVCLLKNPFLNAHHVSFLGDRRRRDELHGSAGGASHAAVHSI